MKLKSQPLYHQVQDIIVSRIGDATWGAGTLLPNEQTLAEEFGVSHGTVRKALDKIEELGLIVRKQGRGTYVATHSDTHERGQFFSLFDAAGEKLLPASDQVDIENRSATPQEASKLSLEPCAEILRIKRNRMEHGSVVALEAIVLPVDIFPGFGGTRGDTRTDIPNFLYPHFHTTYGVLVTRAEERITAEAADDHMADIANIAPGSPILCLDRVAYDLEGTPVEWRIRKCVLGSGYYLSELTL